jgi:N4 gp15-like protein|nr:MAG TPA: DNA directed RNA polymerase [Caudoviricetes sp.]
MFTTQSRVEELLSEQYIQTEVKAYLDTQVNLLDEIYERICQWLIDYRTGVYGKTYASKDERLAEVQKHVDDLPRYVLYSVCLLGKTTLQATATKLGLYIHEDVLTAAKSGSEILAVCDGLGYEIIRPKAFSGNTFEIQPLISIPNEIKQALNLSLFLPPMVSRPNAWTTKSNGGYDLTHNYAILGDRYNKHDNPINLHVLNLLQDVSYRLDSTITKEDDVLDIDSIDPKSREQAQANFNQALQENRYVYTEMGNKPFHFVFQYDKRGRIYSKGYHINIQGNSYRKAMLKFANAEKLTEEGWKWLKIDLANHYGLDKSTWQERLDFIDENIDSMLTNPDEWIFKAEEPLLFKSALNSYQMSLITGTSDQIVRLDATCSGPQLMSVVMRDEEAMARLNVLGDSCRNDFYTLVAQEVYNRTKDSSLWGTNPNFKEIRSNIKKAIMTTYYNSTRKPEEYFGKDTKELQVYYEVLDEFTTGARKLQKTINDLWDNSKVVYQWTLPDSHTAYCPVITTKTSRIEIKEMKGGTAVMNFIHSINQGSEEEKRSLCPNIVHSLDAYVCRRVITILAEKGIAVSPIHDSFGVSPNNCEALRKAYREVLAELYREDIINNILTEIDPTAKLDRPDYKLKTSMAIKNNLNGYYIC